MLADVFRPARRTSVNTFAVWSAGRVAVIDAGSGTYMGPTAGWQLRNLRAAGIDPAAIDTVLLTHMHPDHSAGLADRETGERFYPNAELVVHENEPKHWQDDAVMAQATEREKLLYFQCAREQMKPYRDCMRLITGGEVFPGVFAIPAAGHTPGHTMYLIQSAGDSLLIWGDITHVPEIQIPRPEVTIAFDTDPAAAIAARRRVLDMVAMEKMLVGGMHLHFPAFSRVARAGGGYVLVPEAWVQAF